MSVPNLLVLLAVMALLQVFLLLLAGGLGRRLNRTLVITAFALPLLYLSPWIGSSRLLVPSDELSRTVPGAARLAAPDPHGILNDTLYQLLPWELEVRHALSRGRLPLWSDSLEGGSSPWLNPQSGVLSVVAGLSRPLPIQHHLLAGLVLKMMVALEGAWLLVRALGGSKAAAYLAGLAFCFGGSVQAWALFTPSTAIAWVPWMTLAALGLLRRPRRRSVAVGGCLVACAALAGHPEVAFLGIFFSVLWAWLLTGWRRAGPSGVLAMAAALVLGGALAAPALLPFLQRIPEAQRVEELRHSRLPLEAMDWHPRTWFLPSSVDFLRAPLGSQVYGRPYRDVFRGPGNWAEAEAGYVGLVMLLGAFLALLPRVRKRTLPFLLTSAASLLLVAGFLPLRTLLALLPGGDLLAYSRLLLVHGLVLAVAGALGFDALARGRRQGAALALFLPVAALSVAYDARVWPVLLWGVLGIGLVLARRRRRAAFALIGAVLLADLVPWGLLLLPAGDTAAFYPDTRATRMLQREASVGGPWRSVGEDLAVYPSLLTVYGLDEVRSHNPLAPRSYLRVLREVFDFEPSRRYFSTFSKVDHPLLDFLNVRTVTSYSTRTGAPGWRPEPRTLQRFDAGEFGTFRLFRNPDALPRLFVAVGAEVLSRSQQAEWLAQLRDPRRVALFADEVGDWRPADRRWSPDAVEILEWQPGRARFRVAAGAGSLVATSLPGPKGWRAAAGSLDLEAVTVNGAFLGVRVPAGVEEVEIRYRPPGWGPGLILGITGVIGFGLLLVSDRSLWQGLRSRRAPRLSAIPVLVAILLWLALSLLLETRRSLRPYLVRGPGSFPYQAAARWRLGSPPSEELRRFLTAAGQRIPQGSTVAFVADSPRGSRESYRWMWASYYLPRHEIVPGSSSADSEWWIVYKTEIERPDLERVWVDANGSVLRERVAPGSFGP